MSSTDAIVIASAARTAVGTFSGAFSTVPAHELGAIAIKEALSRGAVSVEPTEEAQDAWVEEIRRTAIDMAAAVRDCTPGYYNGEGEENARFPLGEIYGPGWFPFLELLENWRANGMEGLEFKTA